MDGPFGLPSKIEDVRVLRDVLLDYSTQYKVSIIHLQHTGQYGTERLKLLSISDESNSAMHGPYDRFMGLYMLNRYVNPVMLI